MKCKANPGDGQNVAKDIDRRLVEQRRGADAMTASVLTTTSRASNHSENQ